MKRVAAFFDFDQTLLTTDTSHLLGKYIQDKKLRSFCGKRLSLLDFLKTMAVRLLSLTPAMDYEKLNNVLFEFWKGRSRDHVLELMNDFYPEYIERHLAPALLDKIHEHKNNGHILILVSAGIKDMLQTVTDNLQFDHLICTELEVDNSGIYTGKIPGGACMGKKKQVLAQNIAEKLNIDMENSFSYGNHHNDIPILEIVGNPCAVEPTQKLLDVAKSKGWSVLSFY